VAQKTKQCQFFGAKDWEENRARADGRVDDRGARCFVPQRLRVERRTVTVRRSGPHALTLENTSRWLRECPSLPRLKCSRAARPTRWRCACLSPPPHLFSILLSRCCVWRSHAPLALRCLLFGRAVVVQAFSGFGGALRSFRLEPEAPACARACSCVL
jgi:hypothetical protein